MRYFNCVEVQKILNCTTDIRFKNLFEFLFRSGARISEALALTAGDFDLAGHVNIRCLKTRGAIRFRIVPVDPAFLITLDVPQLLSEKLWIFSRQYAHRFLKRSMRLSGFDLSDQRALHAFRHGFAKICLDSAVDLRDLQRYLGHSSLAITSNYLSITEEYLTKLHGVQFLPSHQLTLIKGEKS